MNSTKGEAATRRRLKSSSPTHRLFPHDCVLHSGQSFHLMTSYHTLSFTLFHFSLHRTKESLFTFRWAARVAATAMPAAPATATASRPEVEVIQPGLALFPGTGIFQEGASKWQRISSAAQEVARNINGRARKKIITMSSTSPGIMLFCAHR